METFQQNDIAEYREWRTDSTCMDSAAVYTTEENALTLRIGFLNFFVSFLIYFFSVELLFKS